MGITKKNIRFYEEQGLLTPCRNSKNGYRDYGEDEVSILRQIKLLRKLGVPLEEIRNMRAGGSTVADSMRRHLVTLEREQRNLEQSMELCHQLKDREERLDSLDAQGLLEEMERMEREGTTFQNKQHQDRKPIRYVAPVVVAVTMTAMMIAIMALMLGAFSKAPQDAPPLPLMGVLFAMPVLIILGVLLAMAQRIREIGKGEIEDAKRY